jgi:glycosyltransferase involved in cell wall biosynthesis
MYSQSCSVIIPIYNDEEVIYPLCKRLVPLINDNFKNYEIIFINDCSSDNSWRILESVVMQYPNITAIDLVKNVGQLNAITAGLDYSKHEIIVIMDSDLQDRPEDIPILVDALFSSDNIQMAIARWISREDSFIKKKLSKLFNNISRKITGLKHHENLGIFRVIKREVLTEVSKYSEKTATSISLMYWIGYNYIPVDLRRDARFAGTSGYNISKMMKLAMDRIFSYSMFPIRLATYSGLSIAAISFIVGLLLIFRRMFGIVASGWTSIIVLILFLFGVTFVFLGIIGEYLGRIFLETKNRPRYHYLRVINSNKKQN